MQHRRNNTCRSVGRSCHNTATRSIFLTHRLANQSAVHPSQLAFEAILSYPVPRTRLDIFSKVLHPHYIEPKKHTQVEETDIMLQLVAAHRGICLLPDWLLLEKNQAGQLVAMKLHNLTLQKTMYLAVRPEDRHLHYIKWLSRESGRIMQSKQQ